MNELILAARKPLFYSLVVAMLASLWMLVFRVDLTPKVESDFFFSTEDPAFQATAKIGESFPSAPQLLFSATIGEGSSTEGEKALQDPQYLERLEALTDALQNLDGIDSVQSLVRGPGDAAKVPESPLWSRLLLPSDRSDDPRTSHLVAFVDPQAADGDLIRRVEQVLAEHQQEDFVLQASGVPYVVELIRRALLRDLRVFSIAALLVFGVVISLLYRAWRPVVGTLLSCVGACFLTLTTLYLIDVPIGILTANIATIVFVLTLSHTVFLTANWRRVRPGRTAEDAVTEGVSITFTASFWCMAAALLGFGSLLLASAKPLRELGVSGMVGTFMAILVAYGFYPAFLRGAKAVETAAKAPPPAKLPGPIGPIVAAAAVLVAAFGLAHLNTDPSLLTYFDERGELRRGLDFIDQSGGSSPLQIVIRDPEGAKLDTKEMEPRLAQLQTAIEEQSGVGSALSLSVLVAEARLVPLAGFLPTEALVNILSTDQYAEVARSFITDERDRSLIFLRMRESGRDQPREEIVARLVETVESAGFEAEHVGGLYDLQGKLGDLVRSSLGRELGGLLLFFVFVAFAVAREARETVAMVLCLAAVPVLLLGVIGHLAHPVDVISAPGANVAIALGIDAMIHLVTAVRRRKAAGAAPRDAWSEAIARMRPAVVGAMLILAAGFGIFILSSFPPTQRFGTLVAVGTLVSAWTALVVLPFLATFRRAD